MDLRHELEMRALHKYLERIEKGEVTGSEPFHVIINLLAKMSDAALNEARRTLIDDRKRSVQKAEPFPLNFEALIPGASQESLIEVSKIFAEDNLIRLGQIEEQEQRVAAEVFHEKYSGRHLQPVS
jgi:hypothetical protein